MTSLRWGAAIGSAALLLAGMPVATSHGGHDPAAAASSVATPTSCKPVPPVAVSLVPGAAAGRWNVQLQAIENTSVTLALGARDARGDVARSVSWGGAMQAGESRQFDLQFVVPAGALEIWAEAAAAVAPGSTLKSRAGLALGPGGGIIASGAIDAGRKVLDSNGQTVVEYAGTQGGAR